MRTILIILAGLVLLGAFMGVARLVIYNKDRVYMAAFWIFTCVWTGAAAANMWIGIVEAGYTFMEELPIFIVIVLVPVACGYVVQRKLRAGVAGPKR